MAYNELEPIGEEFRGDYRMAVLCATLENALYYSPTRRVTTPEDILRRAFNWAGDFKPPKVKRQSLQEMKNIIQDLKASLPKRKRRKPKR